MHTKNRFDTAFDEVPVTWEQHVRDLLLLLGEDPDREGLRDTPRRVRDSWAASCSGYRVDVKKLVKTFEADTSNDDLVSVTNIPVYSHCEHHLLPFFGVAHVAYAPAGRVLGLSKVARIVEAFASRLQVQERLTADIADAIFEHLKPRGVAVVVECRHLCVELRGVRARGVSTKTSAIRGSLERCSVQYGDFLREVRREDRPAGVF